MTITKEILLINKGVTFNSDGEPTGSLSQISVNGYIDFKGFSKTNTDNGEHINFNGKIFISDNSEIKKITFTPNYFIYNNKEFEIKNYEVGLKHIEISF